MRKGRRVGRSEVGGVVDWPNQPLPTAANSKPRQRQPPLRGVEAGFREEPGIPSAETRIELLLLNADTAAYLSYHAACTRRNASPRSGTGRCG